VTPAYAEQADFVIHAFDELVSLVESYAEKIGVCWPFKVVFAAVCLVFRQGRAYVVWLFPINRR